jgi:hypothetical protein
LKTKLEQAIAFINAGDEKRGRELLIEILKSDPANDTAWIWMAAVTNEYQLRKDCLEEALKHNPGNKTAKRALMKLQEQERIPSTTVADKKHPRKRHVNWGHHQSDLSFQSEGQVIQADIVRLYSVIGRGTGDYAEYAYKVDGRRYTDEFMIPHQDWMKMEVGDPILIRYLPSQPESTRYYSYEKDIDPEEEYRQGWIFAGVFLILPMVVEGALAVARESTRKRRNAK